MSVDEGKQNLGEQIINMISSEQIKRIDINIQPELKKLDTVQDSEFIKKISSYYVLKELKKNIFFSLGLALFLIAGVFASVLKVMVGSAIILTGVAFLIFNTFKSYKYSKYLIEKYLNI